MRSVPRALLCMVLLMGSFSGSALAALCADVFPKDATPGTVARLDLSVMDKPGVEYKSFPAKGENYLVSGDYFYRGGKLDNGAQITVTKGRPVRIFIDGDTDFQPHAEINTNGSAEDLLIVVRGDLNIGTKNRINALIYATKNISVNPDVRVEGAVTAEGSISTKVKDDIVYDETAAQRFSSGDLCTPGGGTVADHYRLSFSTPQFSCEPIPVAIRACADATCSSTVAVNQTLSLTPAGRWLGNGTVTFAGTDTVTAHLKRIPGTLRLGVAGEIARCDNGDCELEILQSGFVLGVPNVIAGAEAKVDIRAMRLVDGNRACVADQSFADEDKPRELAFWSQYGLPTSGTLAVRINNEAIGGAEGAATPIRLRFDKQARSSLNLRYDDAGALQLHVRFLGSGEEEGLEMRGSARFVSRPEGFCIQAEGAGCSGADCPLFAPNGRVVRAGDAFDLHITPVAYREGQALCSNPTARQTPNFTGRLQLHASVQEPVGGVDAPLEITEYPHPLGGTYRLTNQKVHEVGSFRIEARSENYQGLAPFDSVGEVIGRFAPAHLDAAFNIPALRAGCGAAGAGFSYQGQPIGFAVTPELTITGKSRNGTTTRNYDRGDYWKLDDELAPALAFAVGQPGDAGRLSLGRLQLQPDAVHDGSMTYRLDGELLYQRPSGAPGLADAPFSPELVLTMAHDELTDQDATCHGESGCVGLESAPFGFMNPASEIRLGRLRIGNAHGSELAGLALPVVAEYFDGQGYRRNYLDSCTRFDPAEADTFVATQAGGVTPVLSYQGNNTGGAYLLQAGSGAYLLSAPGVGGSQRVGFTGLPNWLRHDWGGDGVPEAPSGLATFGIYKGHEKIIFRREVIGR